MRIIDDWQYRYIERCLYDYQKLQKGTLEGEQLIILAINRAKEFFIGKQHEIMLTEFYFNAHLYRNKLTHTGHFAYVCEKLLFTEEPNGYVIRREIVYRVAMNCYSLGIFK